MKKIGIITQYYKSLNYGGNLQSYALAEFLIKNHYNAEQISYIMNNSNKPLKEKLKGLTIKMFYLKVINKILLKIHKYKNKKILNENILKRKKSFVYFNNFIPHSNTVYNDSNVFLSTCNYDCFITGSDQVWNFEFYKPAFFLNFVDGTKKDKISYAASISMNNLTYAQKIIFKKQLVDFKAVSVREDSDLELIKDLSLVNVCQTLDPTLLLEKIDWDKIAIDYPIVGDYIFCYFLGDNKTSRKVAKDYAKKYNLKIVNLPHMCGYTSADKNFGDYELYDVGPENFISLIRNSQIIFTDSFHAVAFSHIYEKEFFVFNRNKKCEMSSRIYSIVKLFETEERFCDTKDKTKLQYIESLKKIDYSKELVEFNQIKKKSMDFLISNLGKAK